MIAYVFVLLFSSNVAFQQEQSCSKFHYEEQTLEKLIRLQIFVEKIKEEMDDVLLKVTDRLNVATKEREDTKQEIQTLKDELGAALIKVTALDDEMSNVNMNNLDVIKKFAENITKLGESMMTPAIAFISHKAEVKSMSDNNVIVFGSVRLNYDDSYDNKNGIFTVPVDGVYMFVANICVESGSFSLYGIYINEVAVTYYSVQRRSYFPGHFCFSLNTLSNVVKWDSVTIKCISGCSRVTLSESEGVVTNTFSGVLIHVK